MVQCQKGLVGEACSFRTTETYSNCRKPVRSIYGWLAWTAFNPTWGMIRNKNVRNLVPNPRLVGVRLI